MLKETFSLKQLVKEKDFKKFFLNEDNLNYVISVAKEEGKIRKKIYLFFRIITSEANDCLVKSTQTKKFFEAFKLLKDSIEKEFVAEKSETDFVLRRK